MSSVDLDFANRFAGAPAPWRRAGWITGGPPPPPIRGVELTQAVQHYPLDGVGPDERENSIPLVAEKELYVRVYLSADAADWPGDSYYHLIDLSVELDGEEVWAAPVPARPTGGRAVAGGSVNAIVPAVRCRGVVDLVVVVRETDKDGRRREVARQALGVDFLRVPRIPVILAPLALRVTGTGKGGVGVDDCDPPDEGLCLKLLDRLARALPVPAVELHAVRPPQVRYVVSLERGLQQLRARLFKEAAATSWDGVTIGVVSEEWEALDPPVFGVSGNGVVVAPVDRPHSAAHELGHLLGRRHTACGGQTGVDPDYPLNEDRPGATEEYGFRIATSGTSRSASFEVLSPDEHRDYMGGGDAECTKAWTSAYGYWSALRGARRCLWRRRYPEADYMLLDLEIADEVPFLRPSYVMSMRPRPPIGEPSPYSVDLEDEDGRVLRRHLLHELELGGPEIGQPEFSSPELGETESRIEHAEAAGAAPSPSSARFIEPIAWDPATRQLVVRHEGRELGRVPLSPDPPPLAVPEVTTVPGPAGSIFAARVSLSWEPDPGVVAPAGDDVTYLVRYSNDAGATWFTVAADLSGTTSLENLDLEGLPSGPSPVFEVVASRGGRSTAKRAAFERPPVPPRAIIAGLPQDGHEAETVRDDETLELVGAILTPDGPPPRGGALRWTATDEHGTTVELGAGERIMVPVTALQRGRTEIQLSADTPSGPAQPAMIVVNRGGDSSSEGSESVTSAV